MVGLASLVAREARADVPGFALNTFEPSLRGSAWFANESLDFDGHLRPIAGVVADYSHKPLSKFDAQGREIASIVSHQAFAHVGGSLFIEHRIRAAFDLPILVHTGGTTVVGRNSLLEAPRNRTALGDARVALDAKLYGKTNGPLLAGVGGQLVLPTGQVESYAGDGGPRLLVRGMVAGKVRSWEYSAQTSLTARGAALYGGGALGTRWAWGLAGGRRLLRDRLMLGLELFGATTLERSSGSSIATSLEVIGGGHWAINDTWQVGAGLSTGILSALGTPRFRTLFSVEWRPSTSIPLPDQDDDGIPDREDACVDVRGVASSSAEMHGCPSDRDGDGIPDSEDACVDAKGVFSIEESRNGCPLPGQEDFLGDNPETCLADSSDVTDGQKGKPCNRPWTPTPKPVAPPPCVDPFGVPFDDDVEGRCTDRDGDGIVDAADACMEDAGDPSPIVGRHGCPGDRDEDGVIDREDACPTLRGLHTWDPRQNGCPTIFHEHGRKELMAVVAFSPDSALIEMSPTGEDVLWKVLRILRMHWDFEVVRISGFSDGDGEGKRNRVISQSRAVMVKRWFEKHGIDSSRLVITGHGDIWSSGIEGGAVSKGFDRRVEIRSVVR